MLHNPMSLNTNTRMRWEVMRQYPELKNLSNKKVLDIGAGLGYFSRQFARLGAEVLAVDVDQSSLDFIFNSYGIETKRLNIEVDDLEENQYDFIFIGEVLEHVENPLDLLRKMERHLKPEGDMMVSTPAMEGPLIHSKGKRLCHNHGAEKHARDGFYYKELQGYFDKIGMEIIKHSFCIYNFAEIFMQFTKLGYSVKKKEYCSQSDILSETSSIPYKILKAIYPFLLTIFKIEQYTSAALSLKGHCHILLARKKR